MSRNLREELDNDLIKEMYVDRKMSTTQIAKEFNCTHRSILLRLKKMGIERRSFSEGVFLSCGEERPIEFDSYETMYDLYVTQDMPKSKIGEMFGVSPACVGRALKNLGIHVRDNTESKIGRRNGENHPNWQGGLCALTPRVREYFDTNIAPKIRERDKYTCQLCGCHSNLNVHHIVHLSQIIRDICNEHKELSPKDNVNELYEIIIHDERFTNEDNLITYCKPCHFYKIHKFNKSISSEAS